MVGCRRLGGGEYCGCCGLMYCRHPRNCTAVLPPSFGSHARGVDPPTHPLFGPRISLRQTVVAAVLPFRFGVYYICLGFYKRCGGLLVPQYTNWRDRYRFVPTRRFFNVCFWPAVFARLRDVCLFSFASHTKRKGLREVSLKDRGVRVCLIATLCRVRFWPGGGLSHTHTHTHTERPIPYPASGYSGPIKITECKSPCCATI
jgi:hypothetical protein